MWNKIKKYVKTLKFPGFVFLISFLGAYAGIENTSKNWRRVGIPVISTIYAYSQMWSIVGWLKSLWTVSIMFMSFFLSMGYGIPASDWPINPKADSGSTLGKFYFKLFKRNKLMANIFTRGTIGLGMAVSLVSLPIFKGNWPTFVLGGLGIILSQATISWRSWGTMGTKLFSKKIELNCSDLLNYAFIAVCIFFIIK